MKKASLIVAFGAILALVMAARCQQIATPPDNQNLNAQHGQAPDYGQELQVASPSAPPHTIPPSTPSPAPDIPDYITIKGIQYSTSLTWLELRNMGLENEDIAPLRHMVNLFDLDLSNNQISDISSLSGLTSLEVLYLELNQISDLSPLAGLPQLQRVGILSNPISGIPPGFINFRSTLYSTSLTELFIEDFWIRNEDIAPLRYMTNLRHLDIRIDSCICQDEESCFVCEVDDIHLYRVSDLSPLSGLTNLTELSVVSQQISDITPLSSLTNLEVLFLGGNQISDITPLSGLVNLRELYLGWNQIRDIAALSYLANLETLDLSGNQINDWSPIAHVPNVWDWS